jgi:plastocyanin
VGDTIVWQNHDVVPHTATAAGVFDTGSIMPGDSAQWGVTKAGRLAYICVFHPAMTGVINATE